MNKIHYLQKSTYLSRIKNFEVFMVTYAAVIKFDTQMYAYILLEKYVSHYTCLEYSIKLFLIYKFRNLSL